LHHQHLHHFMSDYQLLTFLIITAVISVFQITRVPLESIDFFLTPLSSLPAYPLET
jgi:hypothetical protein